MTKFADEHFDQEKSARDKCSEGLEFLVFEAGWRVPRGM